MEAERLALEAETADEPPEMVSTQKRKYQTQIRNECSAVTFIAIPTVRDIPATLRKQKLILFLAKDKPPRSDEPNPSRK